MLRGDIYEFRPPKGTGHEQRGRRYGVVVQADEFLPRSDQQWGIGEALTTVLGLR